MDPNPEWVVTLEVRRGAQRERRSYNVKASDKNHAIKIARSYEPLGVVRSVREPETGYPRTSDSTWHPGDEM